MPTHDQGYKSLFSHAQMVRDLLLGFVPQNWVKDLDFSTLEKYNDSFISDDLNERFDDVIWRIRFRGQWLYVYLIIEFQSKPDAFMAVRLLTYIGLLYQDLIKADETIRKRKRLPPVFPLVLYNGSTSWKAAQSLAELIEPMPEDLQAWQPSLCYKLIEERAYPDEALASLKNLVAILFRLENSKEIDQIARIIATLAPWVQEPENEGLRRAFVEWLNRIFLPARLPGQKIGPMHDLIEVQTMLAERVKEWTRQWKQEGFEKGEKKGREKGIREGRQAGRQEGRQEGRKEGESELLKRLLTKRFGVLPVWVVTKLENASTEQLEVWAERVFDAASLESFFE